MRTNFYIDAFNLYYGCLKSTRYKWLNLEALCQFSFPKDQVNRVRYFTARVKPRPSDPQQPARQAVYLRLATLSRVSIHYGHYLQKPITMPLAAPKAGGGRDRARSQVRGKRVGREFGNTIARGFVRSGFRAGGSRF